MDSLKQSLCRAQNPREGDCFRKGESTSTIRAVGDGMVWYDIQHGIIDHEPCHAHCSLEEYRDLAKRTLTNGATFEAA